MGLLNTGTQTRGMDIIGHNLINPACVAWLEAVHTPDNPDRLLRLHTPTQWVELISCESQGGASAVVDALVRDHGFIEVPDKEFRIAFNPIHVLTLSTNIVRGIPTSIDVIMVDRSRLIFDYEHASEVSFDDFERQLVDKINAALAPQPATV